MLIVLGVLAAATANAQSRAEDQLLEAEEILGAFTNAGGDSIPTDLLDRALGIAVIPNVIRGGFILGARRGRGVLSLRMDDGSWSNPAFVILTGGSIGWQVGAESTDVVLIFANENAVRNMASGKFTLGGEATAVAGPLRKHAASTVTFRAEIYGYLRSRGLYAGAAFQGARLKIDRSLGARFYQGLNGVEALGQRGAATPIEAQSFLNAIARAIDRAELAPGAVMDDGNEDFETEEARTFPLPD